MPKSWPQLTALPCVYAAEYLRRLFFFVSRAAAVLLRLLEELDLPREQFVLKRFAFEVQVDFLSSSGSQTLHSSRHPRTSTPGVGMTRVRFHP